MHWIVQNDLYHEEGLAELMRTLRLFDIPHDLVAVNRTDLSMCPEPMPVGPVMVCGSYTLTRIAAERGWKPGTFMNENHEHAAWAAGWGDRLLNSTGVVCQFGDLAPGFSPAFVRPADDGKFFNGQVLDAEEILAWRDAVAQGRPSPVQCSPRLSLETDVVCAPVATIFRECRFFVVDGEVVAWSTYRIGRNVAAAADVDPSAMAAAREAVAVWQPAKAFVLDMALTPEGYRILEVNCINSAGFYGADVQRIVMAIEGMES